MKPRHPRPRERLLKRTLLLDSMSSGSGDPPDGGGLPCPCWDESKLEIVPLDNISSCVDTSTGADRDDDPYFDVGGFASLEGFTTSGSFASFQCGFEEGFPFCSSSFNDESPPFISDN